MRETFTITNLADNASLFVAHLNSVKSIVVEDINTVKEYGRIRAVKYTVDADKGDLEFMRAYAFFLNN